MTPRPIKHSFRFPLVFFIKILLLLMLLGALIWGWQLLKNPRFMPLQHIKIEGNYQHVDPKTLTNVVSPYVTDQGLFSVNVSLIKQALLQQPWIYSVLVRRVWPDTLEIDITEQQAFALWNDNNLLNVQGDIFSPPKQTFPQNLPVLRGPEDQSSLVLQQFRAWNTALTSLGLSIQKLDLNERLSWQMTLNNNIEVIIGRSDITGRFNRFLEIYPKALVTHAQDIHQIDLRYPDGIAVQWAAKE